MELAWDTFKQFLPSNSPSFGMVTFKIVICAVIVRTFNGEKNPNSVEKGGDKISKTLYIGLYLTSSVQERRGFFPQAF